MANLSSAVRQQEKLQPGRYQLRHCAPKQAESGTAGIINPAGSGFTVLAQTLYAEPLPISRLPDSPDFHEGKYTLRMLDAGDYELGFPNKDASDGRPWRERFSTEGHTEFVEISREGEIEFIGVIIKETKSREKVTITGYDPFFLLKKAYEQEWTGVLAPRDVIERYTELAVLVIGTEFPGTSLPSGWSSAGTAEGEVHVENGVRLSCPAGKPGAVAAIENTHVLINSAARWTVRATLTLPAALAEGQALRLHLFLGGEALELNVEYPTGGSPSASVIHKTLVSQAIALLSVAAGAHTLLLGCDGRWVSGYIDGELVGLVPTISGLKLVPYIAVAGSSASGTVNLFVAKEQTPFLMRGSEKGDYVLPGTASTYPTGGLHGWFTVQGATTNAEAWWEQILSPDPRRSGFPEGIQEQQPQLNGQLPIKGVPVEYYASRWFGAIYLPLSKGNITIELNSADGVRMWIGKTQWGQQLVDSWEKGIDRAHTITLNAASLGSKDGWYPIIIEQFIATGNGTWLELLVTPAVEYTDPGGTVLAAGVRIFVPSTSLSPLGCVDARFQGSSFFDLVQETAKNFGYQLTCEPKQLESGEFPGQIVPKARIGKETDEIVEPDDLDRKSGMSNFAQTLDATDSAGSVKAFGSGIADGKGSQIAFEAVSLVDEAAALFDLQAWCAAGDIAFPALLAARAEAELALRQGSWENVEGEPLARDRLADTFPLTGVLNQFRWRIGDGVRLRLPEVGVADTEPRPIFQITRTIQPEGRVNTSIGFRARPKDPLYAVRTALREATRPARAFQKQYLSQAGQHIQSVAVPASGGGGYSIAALAPQDQVIGANVAITLIATTLATGIEINGVDRTSVLGGPWTKPVIVNILPYAVSQALTTSQRLFVRLLNKGVAEQAEFDHQLLLTLLV